MAEPNEDESVSVGFKGWTVGARGRHLTHLAYVSVLVLIVIMALWAHEQQQAMRERMTQQTIANIQTSVQTSMKEISQKQDETTYVLTLTTEQRERLKLQMPASLRSKTAQRE